MDSARVETARRAAALRRARENLDAQRAVLVREAGERLLEQRQQMRVVARDVPDDPAAVAERGAGEVLAQVAGGGELGRLVVRPLRGGAVAGPGVGVTEREQQARSARRSP